MLDRLSRFGFQHRVRRIHQRHAVDNKRISIEVGLECVGGVGPHTFAVFLHRCALGPFAREQDFLGVRGAQAEGNRTVGVDFRRDYERRRGWGLRRGGQRGQNDAR